MIELVKLVINTSGPHSGEVDYRIHVHNWGHASREVLQDLAGLLRELAAKANAGAAAIDNNSSGAE